jgi:hypothetical protein
MNTHKSIEEIVGEFMKGFPCQMLGGAPHYDILLIKEELRRNLHSYAQQQVQEAVDEYKQFVLNVLDGVDIADEQMGNTYGGTKAIRHALQSRTLKSKRLEDKNNYMCEPYCRACGKRLEELSS